MALAHAHGQTAREGIAGGRRVHHVHLLGVDSAPAGCPSASRKPLAPIVTIADLEPGLQEPVRRLAGRLRVHDLDAGQDLRLDLVGRQRR